MGFILFDASALSKAYTEEMGYETISAFFAHRGNYKFVSTSWGYLETFAVLLRRRNNRVISVSQFTIAVATLQAEILNPAIFRLLSIEDTVIVGAADIVTKHNLNATDAALLTTFRDFAQALGIASCLLVASDKRLIRAARAEGIAVLNPEAVSPADIP